MKGIFQLLLNLSPLAGADGQEGLFHALETIESRLQPLVDKFAELAEKVGSKALNAIGAFNKVLDSGGSIADAFKKAIAELIPDNLKEKFSSLDKGTQSLMLGIGKLLAVVGGGSAVWGALTGALSTLIPGLGALIGPLAGAGGAFKIIQNAGMSVVDVFKIMTGSPFCYSKTCSRPISRMVFTWSSARE